MRKCKQLWRRTAYALVAALTFATGVATARADMIRPGHITGRIELQGLTWTSGTVAFQGAYPEAPSGSGSLVGNQYDALVESGVTYTQVFAQGDIAGVKGYWLTYPTLPVPLDGAVAYDLVRPVGTVHVLPAVTGGFAKPGGLFFTRLQLDAPYEQLSFVIENAPAAEAVLPAAAAAAVVVGGRALVSVTDASGAVLCDAAVLLPDRIVAVAAGASVEVAIPVTVGPDACVTGVAGRYDIGLLPGRPPATQANLIVTGSTSKEYRFTNPGNYSVTGIQPGNYELYPYLMWYSAPYGSLQPPRPRVDVVAGQMTVKDLVYSPAAARGSLTVTGDGVRLVDRALLQLNGGADLAGAYAWKDAAADGTYLVDLVPGTWVPDSLHIQAQEWTPALQYASGYTERLEPSTAFVATANTVVDGPRRSVEVTFSEVFVDFEEPAGVPEVLPGRPWLLAYDAPTAWVKHINASGYREDLPVAPVRLVAAPGTYTFELYANIVGARTKLFAGETLEIGRPVATASGADVSVALVGALGEPLGAAVRFAQVVAAGVTSATVVDVGPAAPPGSTLLPAFGGSRYLYVNTTASYEAAELAVSYDPAALGIAAGAEPALVVRQFTCVDDDHCAWRALPVRVDPAARKVHAAFRGSGAFVLALQSGLPPVVSCTGTPEAPARIPAADTCTATLQANDPRVGACVDGGAGVAACSFESATGAPLELGLHAIYVTGQASDGTTAGCVSWVEAYDAVPPTVAVTASPTVLWPPDGRLVPIALGVSAEDVCTPEPAVTCDAVSSEGDGPYGPAVVWVDGQLNLRAERVSAVGRTYTVTCSAIDSGGTTASASALVIVPHSNGDK